MFANLSETYVGNLVFSLSTLVITYVVALIAKKSIDFIVSNLNKRISHEAVLMRTQTIRSLLKNIVEIILFLIAILIILSRWNINTVPILTGAGILGLAISFGSQTLVKDIISGIFIILENQFGVGDRIKVDKYEGEVRQITLRLTILKDNNGNFIYIPNSQITTVTRLNSKKSS